MFGEIRSDDRSTDEGELARDVRIFVARDSRSYGSYLVGTREIVEDVEDVEDWELDRDDSKYIFAWCFQCVQLVLSIPIKNSL